MHYCILLDDRQKQVNEDFFAISCDGDLAKCRAQTHDTGNSWPLPKGQWHETFVEEKSLIGALDHIFEGRISKFTQI